MTQPSTLGLYIHIPWCPTRCIYCDFNTYIDGETGLKQRYHTALLREISEAGQALNHPPLDTIFIGGGTPTTLTPTQLLEIIEMIRDNFVLPAEAEVATEANPATLSIDYLREIRRGGINRLSLGVQSFSDEELRFLSRLHNADQARLAVDQARHAGFENLNLDLIFNLPHQTLPQWQYTLQEALKLAPEHLSIYSLIVEPGTPLHRQVTTGQVSTPDDDVFVEMYEYTITTLDETGYAHYEISNWAKQEDTAAWETPRLASAHNVIYWRNQPYLGLGAGAFSTINGARWMKVKRPHSYIQRLETRAGLRLAREEKSYEPINRETAMAEHMLMGLRLVREGVSAADFAVRFGMSLAEHYPEAINFGLDHKLLTWLETSTGPHLRLTYRGRFLANQAIIQFL